MARRFFIQPGAIADKTVRIEGALFQHMARVLRLKPGTPVVLADDTGREFTGTIGEIGTQHLIVTIQETRMVPLTATSPRITLYQGLPKGDKMEFILQKAVELGAAGIVPFPARRSVVRIHGREEGKISRWQRIALEAARQSGQRSIPEVALARDLSEVVHEADHEVKLMLWEKERDIRLKQTLARLPHPESVAVLVGPEGGLTDDEAAHAAQGGFIPVSLGERIVRTETAGLVILAILQFYWGDLG